MILKKHKGAASEIIALLWLLNEGYEVYRNVSPHGICDMVAIKDDEILKIDVKTVSFNKSANQLTGSSHTKEQIKQGIKILMVHLAEGKVHGWLDPKVQENYVCQCGKTGIKRNKTQKWCSPECRIIYFHNKQIGS
jgi:Holliday junction resolvase-like predicted endonuclease